ncbi:MAG: carboxypeptidase-like regulatory domain-containing protein, partial [Proteiniphilum sp.]|nr:carboxypeptidase-like regulatory domain-containing protein [Proteiniphilum sp.]
MPLTLRGRIVASDTQNPLSNASVTVKGLNASSVSNQDGYFILRIPESAKNSTLIIRYVGYENV